MSRAVDLAPSGPLALPITGLGRGWEATAIMTLTLILLSVGLVTLYSASAFLAQRQALPDYYYVSRQATGVAPMIAVDGEDVRYGSGTDISCYGFFVRFSPETGREIVVCPELGVNRTYLAGAADGGK